MASKVVVYDLQQGQPHPQAKGISPFPLIEYLDQEQDTRCSNIRNTFRRSTVEAPGVEGPTKHHSKTDQHSDFAAPHVLDSQVRIPGDSPCRHHPNDCAQDLQMVTLWTVFEMSCFGVQAVEAAHD